MMETHICNKTDKRIKDLREKKIRSCKVNNFIEKNHRKELQTKCYGEGVGATENV